jgi:predicted hotdog family 3-hydroxylacyl-ACP dehydratase
MLRDRNWIEAHLPHQGTMCLLDEVLEWDATRVRAGSRAHRSPTNPLRAHGRLGSACGIEFAAQAMALHAALLASEPELAPAAGFLVSLRAVTLHVDRLDDIDDELVATVDRRVGDAASALYSFVIAAGRAAEARPLVEGRATVLLRPRPAAAGTSA